MYIEYLYVYNLLVTVLMIILLVFNLWWCI